MGYATNSDDEDDTESVIFTEVDSVVPVLESMLKDCEVKVKKLPKSVTKNVPETEISCHNEPANKIADYSSRSKERGKKDASFL